jgi:hypothetical protein
VVVHNMMDDSSRDEEVRGAVGVRLPDVVAQNRRDNTDKEERQDEAVVDEA